MPQNTNPSDRKYLQLLAQKFPTIAQASAEIINLQAILNLPKPTEHFLADLHGEHEAFLHVLKNASGNIKRKVNELYGSAMTLKEKRDFCTLIYYPERKLNLIKQAHMQSGSSQSLEGWYATTIERMIMVLRSVASKYTRSKVRKVLPPEFAYIIEELLHENASDKNKAEYVRVIISTIISTGSADEFIIAVANVIGRLAIDRLHILGDIYDRGSGAHAIMDELSKYNDWDIQWGNHDILWMGAAAGNEACICNVIRLSLRYANLTTLEDGYGINMMPLATFALETYAHDECRHFAPRVIGKAGDDEKMTRLTAQMHKAITILQFKAEGQIIKRHPEWQMDDRLLLHHLHAEPTVNVNDPYTFTPEEAKLMERLRHSFLVSRNLRKHIRMILRHGAMYKICNNNLLYHAAIPINDDGTLRSVDLDANIHGSGKELMDNIEFVIRRAFQSDASATERLAATDFFLYLWCGPDSPLFSKTKMATFERYFFQDEESHREGKGAYFRLRDDEKVVDAILDAFGVTGSDRHIINGHVPVHAADGENPIKANGKLFVIDGGFSQPYHKETGIAGYTLVYHSRGFDLVQHAPFTSTEVAILTGNDIKSATQIVEMTTERMRVADTDVGADLQMQIDSLHELLYAYRHGWIKEA